MIKVLIDLRQDDFLENELWVSSDSIQIFWFPLMTNFLHISSIWINNTLYTSITSLTFLCILFQISDIQINGQSEDMTAKEKLLLWSQRMTDGYQAIRCDNFTTSWRDGKLFNAVIHKH